MFNGSCTNDAGLTTDAAPLTVKLDKTGPSATLSVTAGTLGHNGWYTSDVTVSTSGSDSISNPTMGTADQYQTADTTGAVFNGSCTNDAGLTTNASSLTIKRDTTAPTNIQFGASDPADGGVYFPTTTPTGNTCTADDATSGLDSCVVTGGGNSVGTHTLTATATDKAGNQATATRTYVVRLLTLNGYFDPVNMLMTNTVKGGSTVPLKFTVFDQGVQQTSTTVVASFQTKSVSCSSLDSNLDPVDITTTGGTSLRYDSTAQQFIENWQTPKGAGPCYQAIVTFIDGQKISANFQMK